MKVLRFILSAGVVAGLSFGTVLACGNNKDCCKTKTAANTSKDSDKCCTSKSAKAKKSDKSAESAKKS